MHVIEAETRLGDRYVLKEPVATGGMASVWRAVDEVLARSVAVKVLRQDLAEDPDFAERFRREAIAAAGLTHPNVIRVYDAGIDDGVYYIVMEHFEGRTLADVLDHEAPLEPERAVELVVPVLSALEAAHAAGLVHRDVKPGNILVGEDGRVKVADFGIAKGAFTGDLTVTGTLLGTVRYVSPEQVEGSEVDERTDIYSTGVVLYELLTGRPAFQGPNDVATAMARLNEEPLAVRAVRPNVGRDLEAVVSRAMARRKEDRHQSAAQMRQALERSVGLTGDRPTVAISAVTAPRPVTTAPATVATRRGGGGWFRSWMLLPLLLLGLAVAAVAVGLAFGKLEFGGPLGVRGAPAHGGGSKGHRVGVSAVSDLDPQGDGSEHADEVRFAFDGDTSTAWTTDHYASAAFGGLKDGLGLRIDLADRAKVVRVVVNTPLAGWRFEVLPAEGGSPLASTDGETTFTTSAGKNAVQIEPTETDSIVLWVVQLGRDGGGYAASVAEVSVYAAGG